MLKIAIEELPNIIRLAHVSKNNVLVVGNPGVGKSQVIESMQSDTCHTICMTGSSTIEEYVNGIPQVGTHAKGFKQLEYIPSKWLSDISICGKDHPDHMQILFLDEFNTADPQVLKTFLTILSERRIPTCDITLPDNLVIVAAMNPQDQNEGEPLIRPLVSRFMMVKVESSLDQYRKYIAGQTNCISKCDFKLRAKASELSQPQIDTMLQNISLDVWGKYEDGAEHEINPRSFSNFLRAVSWCSNQDKCTPLLSEAFLGIKLKLPYKNAKTTTSPGSYLSKAAIKKLDDKELLDYAQLIYREAVPTTEAQTARIHVLRELNSRNLTQEAQALMDKEGEQ